MHKLELTKTIEMLPNVQHDHVVSMPYALAQGKFEICETWGCCHGVLMVSVSPIRRPNGRRFVPSSSRVETARAWLLVSIGFRVPVEHTASVISKMLTYGS